MKRVALYARCSTLDQNPETQLVELRREATARGWEHLTEYVDHGESGAKIKRPELQRLLADVRARRINTVVVVAFDRLGRSVKDLLMLLQTFKERSTDLLSLREGIDTSSAVGEMVYVIVGAVAQLERSLIIERVRAGMRRAKLEGRRLGRQPLQVDPRRLESVMNRKLSARAAARELGCSTASAWRLIRAHTTGGPDAHGASRAAEEAPHA